MLAAETRRSSATAQRGRCAREKPLPPALGPASSRAARGRGRRPLLRRGLCRWPPRRRNMASKTGPSCRLVFCLLISAAVLRPGKQGPRSSPRPAWNGGDFRGPRRRPCSSGAVRPGGWGRCGHRAGPGFSHLCRTLGPGRPAQVWAGTGGLG